MLQLEEDGGLPSTIKTQSHHTNLHLWADVHAVVLEERKSFLWGRLPACTLWSTLFYLLWGRIFKIQSIQTVYSLQVKWPKILWSIHCQCFSKQILEALKLCLHILTMYVLFGKRSSDVSHSPIVVFSKILSWAGCWYTLVKVTGMPASSWTWSASSVNCCCCFCKVSRSRFISCFDNTTLQSS